MCYIFPFSSQQVAEHKTAYLYGSARVAVEKVKDVLLRYGENVALNEGSKKFLNFTKPFGKVMKNFREACGLPGATDTKFRQFIETKVC